MAHLYSKKDEALFDLKLFSGMNANKGKTLYLKKNKNNKMIIENKFFDDLDCEVEAIALNGKVFLPTE